MTRGAEFAELLAVAAVVREGTFRRAAASLELSPSALSHLVRAAEERLGTRLLNRTTRKASLTEAGAALLARVGPALAEIADAVREAKAAGARPAGTVRLSVPRMAGELVLAPAFGRLARAYPEVRLEVVVQDEMVDIVGGGFDAGIRLRESVPRDMVVVSVGPDLRGIVVAPPAYLADHPRPDAPDDLARHACIGLRFSPAGARMRWEFERDGRVFALDVDGPLTVSDLDLAIAAALDGVGLAYVSEARVAGHLAAGRLVPLLDAWSVPFPGFCLYFPRNRLTPPALRALIEVLRAKA